MVFLAGGGHTQWVGYGGDLEIKNIQNKFIFFVLFHVEDIEDTVYEIQCFKWYACRRRQRCVQIHVF